ncbi:MAG: ABC transporter substrate-binding protein [Proteobacteria bacterium]|nr:ABC transporter substrate-binding protein [Pseudomonadota bacterium]
MLRKVLLTTALVALVSVPSVAQAQNKTVTLIQPNNGTMGFYGLHSARLLGYFEEEGIDVKLLSGDTSVPYAAFLTNGDVDLAMLDGSETFQAMNANIGAVTVYTVHNRAPEGIFVAKDSPLQSVNELKGKTIGLASDRDLAVVKVAMAHAGSNADGIKTVVVGDSGPTLANVFLKGTAAAFAGSGNDVAALLARGIELRDIMPESAKNSPANTYSMLASRMDEMKEPLCGFFRAYSKGVHVGLVDMEAVAALSRKGVPHEWESSAYGYNYLNTVKGLQTPSDPMKIGEVNLEAWKGVQKDMVMIGAVKKEGSLDAILSNDFIGCANDFDRAEVAAEVAAWMADPANAEFTKKPATQ